MDFNVPAPGGVPAGNAAALAARGADPAIDIPAGAHFFRRIAGLVLAPVAGALAPVPTTLPQSVMELVLGPALNTGGLAAVQDRAFLLSGILPAKFEAALAQLEAEPAGVGLNPAANYPSLEAAVAEVRAAARRVAAQAGPVHPSYIVLPGDVYALEPMPVGAPPPAAFVALGLAPTALIFGDLCGPSGWLSHYGDAAFAFYGRSQSANRDAPGTPSRNEKSLLFCSR